MNEMLQTLGIVLAAPFVLYLVARIVCLAYFNTRKDYKRIYETFKP